MDQAHPQASPQAHGESAAHPHVNYFSVWWILLILTVGEVAIVYIPMARVATVVSLIVFALVKAMLVAAYFMHLKFEKRTMILVAAAPMIFATILAVGVVPDADKELSRKKAAEPAAPVSSEEQH